MLSEELTVATDACRRAMDAIRAVADTARKDPTIKPRGQGPVTEADLAADKIIREQLVTSFPDDHVVTEETWDESARPPPSGRVWFVDPLDGTQEFVRGNDDYCVMIGLVVDGAPQLGVLGQPSSDIVWRGVLGAGAERISGEETVALEVTARPLPELPRAAVSRSHPSKLTERVANVIGGSTVPRGSVGLKIAAILDEEVDVYLSGSSRMKLWDTAGPLAVLRAAGGDMSSLDGEPLSFVDEMMHKRGLFAAPPVVRAGLNERVKMAVSDWRAARKNR